MENMENTELTEEALSEAWKAAERERGKWVGVKTVCNRMKIKPYHVTQMLQGERLTDFKLRHGIQISPQESPYTPDQLLSKYDAVVSKLKKIPTWQEIRFETGTADSAFKRRFGPTQLHTVTAYHKWFKKNKSRSRNLKVVENWLKGKGKPAFSLATKPKTCGRRRRVSDKTEGRTYGPPLGYENLVYAPANEQGVIVLFAIMSKHLQYYIEGVWGDSFPDCEAMRVEVGGKRRRVKIEFEYRSRDFLSHGHDSNGCDVLVCWKDNWSKKDRPSTIEVLELSREIEQIRSSTK